MYISLLKVEVAGGDAEGPLGVRDPVGPDKLCRGSAHTMRAHLEEDIMYRADGRDINMLNATLSLD